jgi:multicomponent Na+:H+ antiporter subunit C
MEFILAILVGILFAGGAYLLLRKCLFKMILGIVLLGNGVNFLIFLTGGVEKGKPPVLTESFSGSADPIPQALILTAIVISFGLQSFALILLQKIYRVLGTDDLESVQNQDEGDL